MLLCPTHKAFAWDVWLLQGHVHTHTHTRTQVKGLTCNAKCQPGGQLQAKLRKRFSLSEQCLIQTSGRSTFKWLSIRIPAAVPASNCLFSDVYLWSIGWLHVMCGRTSMPPALFCEISFRCQFITPPNT